MHKLRIAKKPLLTREVLLLNLDDARQQIASRFSAPESQRE
jgi:hypothetical protein